MASNSVRIPVSVDDNASRPLDKIRDKFDTLGKTDGGKAVLRGFGFGAGISTFNLLGDAIHGVTGEIGDTITKASDLNETMSKSAVIFGTDASAVDKWGDTAARSLGLSKQQAIEARASIGNLFKTMGLGQQDVLDMSGNLVGLAGDLASFNNIDPTDALDKLRSGLVGEAEPLRALGVQLTEATVAQEAQRLGLVKTGGTLSEAAKVQARYSLILKQTKTAQGDFGRTSEGLANSQRILNAEIADGEAKIGQMLLPVVKDLVHGLSDAIPVAEGFVGSLGDIAKGAQDAVGPLARLNDTLTGGKGPVDLLHKGLETLGEPLKGFNNLFAETGYQLDSVSGKTHTQDAEFRHMQDSAGGIPKVMDKLAKSTGTAGDALGDLAGKTGVASDAIGTDTKAAADAAAANLGRLHEIAVGAHDQMVKDFDAKRELEKKGREDALAFARGLTDRKDSIDQAGEDLLQALRHPISTAKRILHLEGQLASGRLKQGLKSNDPAIRQAAIDWKTSILAELAGLKAQSKTYGQNTGKAYGDGLAAEAAYVKARAKAMVDAARGVMEAFSPPGPESPLHDIAKWGAKTGIAWADALASGIGTAPGKVKTAMGGIDMDALGGPTFRSPFRMPGMATIATGSGAPTVVINVNGVSVLTPGAARALGDQIGPAIAAHLQRKGVLPRMGTGQTG